MAAIIYPYTAKIGIDGVNSSLATAIRTVVVVAMAWGMVLITAGTLIMVL